MRVNKNGVVEIDFLAYTGRKESGTITILPMKGSSPYRFFKFQRGGRYEVGKDVAPLVAEWLVKYHKSQWTIVSEAVDGNDAFVVAFANLLSVYKPVLNLKKFDDFLPLLEQGFEKEGSEIKIRRVASRRLEQTEEDKKKKAADKVGKADAKLKAKLKKAAEKKLEEEKKKAVKAAVAKVDGKPNTPPNKPVTVSASGSEGIGQ